MLNPQNQSTLNDDICLQRRSHLDIIFKFKTLIPQVTRNIMFLSIAIFDKFLSKIAKQANKRYNLMEKRQIRSFSCIWMAIKFQGKNMCSLNETLQKTGLRQDIGNIVQMESQILQVIDFEIPQQTAFTRMTADFYSRQNNRERTQQNKLAAKALGFLLQAIKHSIDFSLYSQLGSLILNIYLYKTLTDPRIKSIYMIIKNNKDFPKNFVYLK